MCRGCSAGVRGDRISGVSRGVAVEGGQPRRGVWCLVTYPELFYPLLAACCGQQRCPDRALPSALGRKSPGRPRSERSQRCLLAFLPCHVPPLGSSVTEPWQRAGRGLSRLERIQSSEAGEHRDPRVLPAGWSCLCTIRAQPLAAFLFHLTGKPGPGTRGEAASSAWLNPDLIFIKNPIKLMK